MTAGMVRFGCNHARLSERRSNEQETAKQDYGIILPFIKR